MIGDRVLIEVDLFWTWYHTQSARLMLLHMHMLKLIEFMLIYVGLIL